MRELVHYGIRLIYKKLETNKINSKTESTSDLSHTPRGSDLVFLPGTRIFFPLSLCTTVSRVVDSIPHLRTLIGRRRQFLLPIFILLFLIQSTDFYFRWGQCSCWARLILSVRSGTSSTADPSLHGPPLTTTNGQLLTRGPKSGPANDIPMNSVSHPLMHHRSSVTREVILRP